jgi:DNA-binding NarL/FixJ family response regulator
MRIVIYSPVRLFGEGIGAFLQSIDRIEAVLVESDPLELETRAAVFRADVALFDVTGHDVIPLARIVRAQCPEIIAVAMAVAEVAEDVIACADAGFAAYIPRAATAAEMIAIVDLALRGETVCDRRIARSLFDELARRSPTALAPPDEYLTPREIEMARMLARGLTNKEIAKELHLSVATIKNHVHSVIRKLQVHSRLQVANLLLEDPFLFRPQSGPRNQRLDAGGTGTRGSPV